MEPSIAEIPEKQEISSIIIPEKAATGSEETAPKVRRIIDEEDGEAPASYLPIWDHGEKYPPLERSVHVGHGLDADPAFKDLLPEVSTIQKFTPTIGSEVYGVQLSKLSAAARTNLPIEKALEFGGYFGRHHIHPTSGAPEGHPEIHVVYRNGSDGEVEAYFANRNSRVQLRSDVSYEQEPP
ncbi:hypothetical protein ZTR_08500 [Talaromyces verruculosus]|nr:hypothetical protein ZTR_08500 [Talaromyces verruculosus]